MSREFATGPFFQTEIRTFAHQYKITELPITYNAATQHVHQKALADAFKQLKRLWRMKSNKELVLHG